MFVPRTLTSIARSGATHILETYTAASLLSTLTTLGLTGNLKLCLDAGEGDSYTSGQKWLDLSGGGYDFFLGADVGATATDPTFNGVADALSSAEFFSFDGGDVFRYDSANEAWMNALHQSGAVFTFMAMVYPGSAAQFSVLGDAQNSNSNVGVFLTANASSGSMSTIVFNGSGSQAFNHTSGSRGVTAGAWQLLTWRVDQVTPRNVLSRNIAHSSTNTSLYTTPSAASSTYALEIGANGNGGSKLPNTSRVAMVAVWDAFLTDWQLEQIYNKTRRRFGV